MKLCNISIKDLDLTDEVVFRWALKQCDLLRIGSGEADVALEEIHAGAVHAGTDMLSRQSRGRKYDLPLHLAIYHYLDEEEVGLTAEFVGP